MSRLQIFECVDCMDGMKKFEDNFFQLAIVDPPYGINATKMSMGTNKSRENGGYPSEGTAVKIRKGRLNAGAGKLKNRALNTLKCDWDYAPPGKEYFEELFRVSENQIIFGGNYFDLPPCRGFFVWDKIQPWENFSQVEFAWTSFDCPAKLFRFSNTGGRNNEEKINAVQKPIALYEWILNTYANKGARIIDTHVGSGSSLIACHKLGFDYVGFEIDEEQYDKTVSRIEKHSRQTSIFEME